MSFGEVNLLNEGPGDSARGMREGRRKRAGGSCEPKERCLPLFRREEVSERDRVAIRTAREDILLSRRKSTLEQDVRNVLKGGSAGAG